MISAVFTSNAPLFNDPAVQAAANSIVKALTEFRLDGLAGKIAGQVISTSTANDMAFQLMSGVLTAVTSKEPEINQKVRAEATKAVKPLVIGAGVLGALGLVAGVTAIVMSRRSAKQLGGTRRRR